MSAAVIAPSPFTSSELSAVETVTLQNAVSPLSVLAIIVASPGEMPLTEPLLSIVATDGFADCQVIVAADPTGKRVGVSVVDSPTFRFRVDGIDMLVGFILLTVTLQ